jgi:hypothetical protein
LQAEEERASADSAVALSGILQQLENVRKRKQLLQRKMEQLRGKIAVLRAMVVDYEDRMTLLDNRGEPNSGSSSHIGSATDATFTSTSSSSSNLTPTTTGSSEVVLNAVITEGDVAKAVEDLAAEHDSGIAVVESTAAKSTILKGNNVGSPQISMFHHDSGDSEDDTTEGAAFLNHYLEKQQERILVPAVTVFSPGADSSSSPLSSASAAAEVTVSIPRDANFDPFQKLTLAYNNTSVANLTHS